MSDLPRLHSVFGTEPLARLIDRLVARLEHGEPLTGTITLRNPTDQERDAVGRLLGKPSSQAGSIRIGIEQLNRIVRNGGLAKDLREAVEAVRGPCADRRNERRQAEEQWAATWSAAQARINEKAQLLWLDSLRRDGTLRRLAGGDASRAHRLLASALAVLRQLPSDGVLLAELAAAACGDSHALDNGAPTCTLVLRALACMQGGKVPLDRRERRALWERFGVVCDELSAPVLVLNLRCRGDGCIGRALAVHVDAGEPYRISTRQLLREGEAIGPANAGPIVYVCENVSVLAAAANRFGRTCPAVVCLDGHPKTAARLLLDRLRGCGCRLLYHGDFDWAGITIANAMYTRHGALPWRMATADYQEYAARGTSLDGQPVNAAWDAELCDTMQRNRRAVHEELVIERLLGDLEAVLRVQCSPESAGPQSPLGRPSVAAMRDSRRCSRRRR